MTLAAGQLAQPPCCECPLPWRLPCVQCNALPAACRQAGGPAGQTPQLWEETAPPAIHSPGTLLPPQPCVTLVSHICHTCVTSHSRSHVSAACSRWRCWRWGRWLGTCKRLQTTRGHVCLCHYLSVSTHHSRTARCLTEAGGKTGPGRGQGAPAPPRQRRPSRWPTPPSAGRLCWRCQVLCWGCGAGRRCYRV